MPRLTLPEQAAEEAQLNARLPSAPPGTHPNGRSASNGPNNLYDEDFFTGSGTVIRRAMVKKGTEWHIYQDQPLAGNNAGWSDPVTDQQVRGF